MADFNFYINRQGIQGRKGDKGETGFSPAISVGTDTPHEYKLIIANESNSFETPNLRGNINVIDNGGTYLRYDAETQQISAQGLDAATSTNVGGVLMSTDADIEGMGDGSVITPADLADALPIYLEGEGAVTITQDEETSKTKIGVDLSSVDDLTSRVSAAEAEIIGIQADVADLDADNTDNKAIIDAHTNSIANINDSIESLQQTKQAKLTAGEGITIDENNVISAEGGGTGDVTAAGDNTFTGSNRFTQQLSLGDGAILQDYIPIEFGSSQFSGSRVMNRASISNELTEHSAVFPSGLDSYMYANTLRIDGGYNLILDAGYVKDQDPMTATDYTYKGKILDGDGNVILSQGNVTAGEGVTINKTDDGIEIVVDNAGGDIDTSNLVTLSDNQTITGMKTFQYQTTFGKDANLQVNLTRSGSNRYHTMNYTGNYIFHMNSTNGRYGFQKDPIFTDGSTGGETSSPESGNYQVYLRAGNITSTGGTVEITNNGLNGINIEAVGGGGSAPENMVTTDTNQQITGQKSFSQNLAFDDSYTSGKTIWMGKSGNGAYGLNFQSGNAPYQFRIHNQGYTASSLWVEGFGGGVRFDNTVNFDSSIYDKDGNEIVGGGGGSSVDTSNLVTTDTEQAITSNKTISNNYQLKFECGNTANNGAIYGGTNTGGNLILECQNQTGATPEKIMIGAQGTGSNYGRRGIFLSVPTNEAIYLGDVNSACKIEAVNDLKLYGGYSQNSYLHLSNDELKYTKSDGTSVDLLASAASAVSAASETGGVTGDLKDSTGTAIAKVENGIITEFYF